MTLLKNKIKPDKDFFIRPAPIVARDLLGKYLVRRINGKITAYKITEVEAYEGLEDLASHASKGRTKRTEIMFGEAGKLYIYLVYGMHHMLNIVTGQVGYPSAVLIRSVENIVGPGRLTKILKIDKSLNALDAFPKNNIWFEDRGEVIDPKKILATPRIGVDYAGPIWSKKKYRFMYNTSLL
jgi:DNA-3-methyladenine glycosylase